MSVAEQVESLSHEELVRSYLSLREQNTELSEQNEELKVQNDWLKRQLFGKKSERILPSDDSPHQLTLGEGYEPEDKPPPKKTTVKSYERSHRKDEVQFADEESRLKFDGSVPVEVVNVLNPATEGLDEDEYEVIGEEVAHKLAQRPGAYVVLKYVRPKVKVQSTGEVITSPVTPAASVIERSIAEVSFLVGLILDKFLYHLPLNRQHQRLTAAGIYLNRMTLTNLVHRSAQLLEPVYVSLQSSILLSSVIAMDETPVKAGRDKGKRQMKKGYFWSIYGEKEEIAFLFSPSRSGKLVRDVLENFEGTLLTDAYKVYDIFAELNAEVTRAQCWAHARRKFFDAKDYEPELAEQALDAIRLLYKIEKEHGPKGRTEHARPVVNEFFDW
ncbi:MAG: IS66 family transposase, partial [Bdellovibrionales bacterium]|nr:IS66 family transposase [Bdellovibrionales bacterium]